MEIMDVTDNKVAEIVDVLCVECGSGDKEGQLLLCHKCDRGYHMTCVHPIIARVPVRAWNCPTCSNIPICNKSLSMINIFEFFKVNRCDDSSLKMISSQETSKRKKKTRSVIYYKKSRALLPYVPSKDYDCRMKQMQSLASSLKSLNLEFSNDLTYPPGMAPKSANQAFLENGCIQVLSKRDTETLNKCRSMAKRGEFPPLLIVYDSCEGYTVQADARIKDMTLIAEYTGDVDYIKNREYDDCNSMMTLLLASDPNKSLLICPDKRGNIVRFVSGINNYIPESRKKRNTKCVRYNVDGVCRVLLVSTREIAKGETLYYDYNGDENVYPTHNFV